MKNIDKGTVIGFLYFYVHLVTEVVCFYLLTSMFSLPYLTWFIALSYDALAFVPQSLFGYYSDSHRNIPMGLIGIGFLTVSLIIFALNTKLYYLSLVTLCIGNCLTHVAGAEKTLRGTNGKAAPSATFVGGGSFGVIIGRLAAQFNVNVILIILIILSAIPYVLFAESYAENKSCEDFNYHNPDISKWTVVIFAFLIVIVRGYLGYAIPTTWKKTLLQNVIFYFTMGTGKVLGGFFIDWIGIRKTSFISIIAAIPFLILGGNIMYLSITGVMFYSMTMSVTLVLLTSVLKNKPGLAFGITTIGLFLGTVPIFFYNISDPVINALIIIILSIPTLYMALKIEGGKICR